MANTLIDPDIPSDIALAKGITPYSENFLPMFDFIAHGISIWQGDQVHDVRFPALVAGSNIAKTVDQIQGWFKVEDIETHERFTQALGELAELGSGFNNISQGLMILGSEDKVTSNGNKLGWQQSRAEAWARMLGASSNKELRTYEMITLSIDNNEKINAVVDTVHKLAMNARNKIGTKEYSIEMARIRTFLTMIAGDEFTPSDMDEAMKRLLKKDRQSEISLKQSIIGDMIRHRHNTDNAAIVQILDRLKKQNDPNADELINFLEGRETRPIQDK
jgi:hypothetical protein